MRQTQTYVNTLLELMLGRPEEGIRASQKFLFLFPSRAIVVNEFNRLTLIQLTVTD